MYQQDLNLTPEQIAEFQEAFNIFDKNGDRRITVKELGIAMRSLGLYPSEAEIQDMFNSVDLHGNGTIEFDQFLYLMSCKVRECDTELENIDESPVNGTGDDGKITVEILTHINQNLGEPFTQEEIDEIIEQADINKDGIIDYNEFVNRLLSS